MLFRLKITKCVDIIIESSSLDNVLKLLNNLVENCSSAERIFVHVVERKDNELINKGIVYSKEIKVD